MSQMFFDLCMACGWTFGIVLSANKTPENALQIIGIALLWTLTRCIWAIREIHDDLKRKG